MEEMKRNDIGMSFLVVGLCFFRTISAESKGTSITRRTLTKRRQSSGDS